MIKNKVFRGKNGKEKEKKIPENEKPTKKG